jgi:hypothetical protein
MKTAETLEESGIIMQDNLESGFFRLLLLTRCSDSGIMYSTRTNYRLATTEKMTVKNNLKKSMMEYALSQGDTEEFNPKIALTFYQIKKKTSTDSKHIPLLSSIGKESVWFNGYCGDDDFDILMKDTIAKQVNQYEFLKLCYIFNETPLTIPAENKRHDLYDFGAILRNKGRVTITNNEELMAYVKDILGWSFFEIANDVKLSKNIWRVRSFLQTLTGVGISIVEGAHRIVLTTKLMTAMPLDEVLPSYPDKYAHLPEPKIPSQSPTWSKANVQVLSVKNNMNDYDSNGDIIIKQDRLHIYQQYSQKIAEQKTHFIDSNWRDWIGAATQRISDDPSLNRQFDQHALSKLEEPPTLKSADTYLKQHRMVMTHVANCLFDMLPASRLAESARTWDENNKNKSKIVNRDEYSRQILQGKWGKYPHQYWAGVSG